MRRKRRLFVTLICSLGIAVSCFKQLSVANEMEYIVDNYQQLVNEATDLFEEYYKPIEYYSSNETVTEDSELLTTLYTVDLQIEFGESTSYWVIVIHQLYNDLSIDDKQILANIKNETVEFELAYDILAEGIEPSDSVYDNYNTILDSNLNLIKTSTKGAAVTAATAFSVLTSMISGINTASWIPFVGWAVAAVLVVALIVYIVANWSAICDGFNSFISSMKKTYSRIADLLTSAVKEAEEQVEDNPDYAEDATKPGKMQEEVEKGQAPRSVKAVDDVPSNLPGQPHVHFKDGTALNRDGTIHDKHKGTPNPTNETWDWLHGHGWCLNGIKK